MAGVLLVGAGAQLLTGCNDASADALRPAARPHRGALGNGTPITLVFGGDASFEGLGGAVAANPGGVLRAIAPTLSGADFAMVNLETALGTAGAPVAKSFTFHTPAATLDALGAAGVDAVTMANNHGMDYGAAGLQDTLAIRSARAGTAPAVLGIGADEAEAYAPLITEVKGQRLGVIAASDVFDDHLRASWTAGPSTPGLASAKEGSRESRLLAEVRATRDKVDTLVVYLHMGREKDTCPTPRQEQLTAALQEAGVDVVVGSHAHRLQGAGFRDNHFVAYGLGNFVFKAPSAEATQAAALQVTVTGRRVDGFHWVPAVIRNNVPVPLTGAAEESAQQVLDQRRQCAGLSATPTAPYAGATASADAPRGEAP
jgi:poly-gamma-glutamate capsule biosynthesis protein CapA/YwtB (metallophosphatase superfamily)